MLRFLRDRLRPVAQRATQAVGRLISRWCKRLPASPLIGTIADLARSKSQLVAENLLRQQLIVLSCAGKRPHCTRADRILIVVLASRVKHWREALLIVRPETVPRDLAGAEDRAGDDHPHQGDGSQQPAVGR